MASLRQLRGRIKSIQNSKQIMRAMQLVSGSKLKRSQDKLMQARVVLEFLDGLVQRVFASTEGLTHPLATVREDGESALVILTSDTGLCGSYNTNLIQLAEAHLRRDSHRKTQLIFIGKRAHRYFTKRGYPAAEAYLDLAGRPNPAKATAIGRALIERFVSGHVNAVDILYSRFLSATVYKPTIQRFLPVALELQNRPAGQPAQRANWPTTDYIFEPSAERVFEDLLPRWALAKFQLILLEGFTSEHSARMIAMKNATDNAEELLQSLTMQRNRVRQAAITKELSEIVGTVEALK